MVTSALVLLAEAASAFMGAQPSRLSVGATVIRPVAISEPAPFERLGAVLVIRNSPAVDIRLTGGSAVAVDPQTILIRPAGTQRVDLTLIY
jgi:hypothetical protein